MNTKIILAVVLAIVVIAAVADYCRSGRRSASAAQKLVKLGYEVINLDRGILAWQRAKMPISSIT